MRTLRARVTLAAMAGAALVFALMGAVTLDRFADRELSALDRELEQTGTRNALDFGRMDWDDLPIIADRCCPAEGRFTRITSKKGRLMFLTKSSMRRFPGAPREGHSFIGFEGERWRVYRQDSPVSRPPQGTPVVEVAQLTRALDARVAGLRNWIVGGGVLGTLLIGAAVWWLSRLALSPVTSMREGALELARADDLTRRLPEYGPPELSETAHALNRMIDRLQVSYRQARSALDATRTFTADAGHELRTPLTSLRANLDVLSRADLQPEDRDRSLRDSLAAHTRLTVLIEGLQTLARGDAAVVAARSGVLDLAELADAAVVDARRRHGDVAFGLEASPQAPVEGDPDGLRMLLDNLLENAAVHGAGRVRALVRQGDGYVLISVDDDGPGIPDVEKGRVFERFARGSGARNGTGSGLGLAIAAQQAELHGGRLKLDDSPLGGARFELTLSARASS